MRIKVCGITCLEDALLAADLGADALGFNFFRHSPRYIEPARAREILRKLPPLLTAVGVFVNLPAPGRVSEIARAAAVQAVQLHGDELPEYCAAIQDVPVIKALRLGNGTVQAGLDRYPVSAFLLDARDDVLYGGTGKTFDWSIAAEIARLRPIILAGGLHPGNVAAAIEAAKPYAVDVCSGVELSPGRKDPKKLAAFITEVRNAWKPD